MARPLIPDDLDRLVAARVIPATSAPRARELGWGSPTPAEWTSFTGRVLMGLGTGLFVSGVIFFFAFNWAALGRFGKLGLVAGLVLAAAAFGRWRGLSTTTGKSALTGASVLTGALLALYGQIYQTGADPFQLFFGWAALILPWVIVARFGALTLLFVAVLQTGLVLFWGQVVGESGPQGALLALVMAAVCAAPWVLAELLGAWLPGGWWVRVLAVATFVPLVAPAIVGIVEPENVEIAGALSGLLWMAALAVVYYRYRLRQPDLFMLSVAGASIAVVLAVAAGRVLLGDLDLQLVGLLLLSAVILGEVAALAAWLRQVSLHIGEGTEEVEP